MTRREYKRWVEVLSRRGGVTPGKACEGEASLLMATLSSSPEDSEGGGEDDAVQQRVRAVHAASVQLVERYEDAVRGLIEIYGELTPTVLSVLQNDLPLNAQQMAVATAIYGRNPALGAKLGITHEDAYRIEETDQ